MLICRRKGGAMKQVRAQSEVTVVCMCVRACADMLEAIVFAVRRWRLVMGGVQTTDKIFCVPLACSYVLFIVNNDSRLS